MQPDDVLLPCILVLQFFTALTLAVHLYKCIRRKELPKFLRYVRAAYLRCRDMLGSDTRDTRDRCMEQRVNRKFHETLCNLLVAGSNLMVIVLFFRLSVYQWHLLTNANHLLTPALDISSVAGYAVVLFMISFRQLVTPRSLDLWYFALQGLNILPLAVADPADIASLSLITLMPRFLCGLAPRHGWCAVVGNFLHWLLALYQVGFQLNSSTFAAQSLEFGIVVAGILAVRRQMYINVRTNLDLKTRTIELEAVSGLLLGFCDAVVEVEAETLQLTEDSRQLSTMLLHGQRLNSAGLAGRNFLGFFSEEDRERIKDSLGTGGSQTLAINARMLDSLGSHVKVELLHIQFRNPDGHLRRLIGMREFQDLASVAPALSSQQILRSEESPPAAPAAQEEVSVLFDANTFDILSVSKGFQALCTSVGQAMDFEGLSVFDLSKGTGPKSFSRQLQEVLHAYDEKKQSSFALAGLDLLGACQLEATVTFAEDTVLQSLVGTLTVITFASPAKLTERNLAMLQSGATPNGRRSRSKGSRASSRGSRGSGKSQPLVTTAQSKQGSILALRSPTMSL
ncbi:unnamed protein product [Symbiodinium sp. CCMP2456]|nr:unnamed protein product [Symbiodinium sp. CCMP2456]